jgi:hypothetical protein
MHTTVTTRIEPRRQVNGLPGPHEPNFKPAHRTAELPLRKRRSSAIACAILLSIGPGSTVALSGDVEAFGIQMVDAATGRGVPLVTLETTDRKQFVTDSAGFIAIVDPGFWGVDVYFRVRATHGYQFPADGFGYRGRSFSVEPGKRVRMELERLNLAERLYRTTGAGIYEHAIRLGETPPIDKPLLNAQVTGSDSILAAVYRDRIYWFWGDTDRASYPLGNFHTTAGTSPLPRNGGLPPDEGVNLSYVTRDDGFVRSVAVMPGDGPTWMGGLTVLRDNDGSERLFAIYTKIRSGTLDAYDWGTAVWNDETEVFDPFSRFDHGFTAAHSQDHTFLHAADDGTRHVYFGNPFPMVRVEATPMAFADRSRYESFTPLVEGTKPQEQQLDRDADGRLQFSWKPNTPWLRQADERRLVEAGVMAEGERRLALRDLETERTVRAHTGSVYWNEYRERWVMIFVEIGGQPSHLGEVWYAEAEQFTGPWGDARKILTHERMTFYNPKHHPFLDQDGGRIIYFEGTYTKDFAGHDHPTPRYDYNQVMYRLNLADPRLRR